MTQILLLRHGRTAYNAAHRLQGQIDIPLDDVGRWQAGVAARALAPTLPRGVRIVSSDLRRASATAHALAELTGSEVVEDARLRERAFGEWDGLTGPEIRERWPDEYAAWTAGLDPHRSGAETRAQVAARVTEALAEHAAEVDTVVGVSHGATITLGITSLIELDAVSWRGLGGLDNAHWSILSDAGPVKATRWRLVGHNRGPVAEADWNSGPARP